MRADAVLQPLPSPAFMRHGLTVRPACLYLLSAGIKGSCSYVGLSTLGLPPPREPMLGSRISMGGDDKSGPFELAAS